MNRGHLSLLGLLGLLGTFAALGADDLGKDMISCQVSLPNGEVYLRGATDPVKDLVVKMVLTNKTAVEKKEAEAFERVRGKWLTEEEITQLGKMKTEEQVKWIKANKVERKNESRSPVNKASIGFQYVTPDLGPHDVVRVLVKRVQEGAEGEAVEQKKPEVMERDMGAVYTDRCDLIPSEFVAAGESSPEYLLPVGCFYKIMKPGLYSLKVIVPGIADSQSQSHMLESNELRFRVLPFKLIDKKIEEVRNDLANFERGHPDFDYMFYQLPVSGPYQEIWFVNRFNARGIERWEWHRLCSLAEGQKAQVAQIDPKKVAILARQQKGDAGLYTIDFSKVDPIVSAKTLELKEGKVPTLRVEGGQVTAE